MSQNQDGMHKSPRELFQTLARILQDAELLRSSSSEIAISPYIIPPDDTSDESSRSEHAKIYPFTLIEGDKLAIPQKPLYALFAYCIVALSAYPRNVLRNTSPIAAGVDEAFDIAHQADGLRDTDQGRDVELENTLDNLTKCIIVQNPEHSRAMNIRKRLLLQRLHGDASKDSQKFRLTINNELHFVELVLGIAANSKMGSLWHHRRWLLQVRHALCNDAVTMHSKSSSSTSPDLSQRDSLYRSTTPVPLTPFEYAHEFALVELCAERYPRNYQAWAYRTWLLQGQLEGFQSKNNDEIIVDKAGDVLSEECRFALSHLGRNVGDHTVASYLVYVLHEARLHTRKNALQNTTDTDAQSAGRLFEQLLAQAAEFTLDFVRRYPHKETPWLLLRGIIRLSRQQQTASKSAEHLQLDNEALSLAEELSIFSRDGRGDSKAARNARLSLFVLKAQSNADLGGPAALQALQMS